MIDENLNEENETELEPTPYQNDYRRNLEEPQFNEEEDADNIREVKNKLTTSKNVMMI